MIVVVDDEEAPRSYVEQVLARAGHRVVAFASAGEALEYLASNEPSLIISDVVMPVLDGRGFRERYGERFPERRTAFVFLSSLSGTDDIVSGFEVGADDYLTKPIDAAVLLAKVRALLRRAEAGMVPTFRGDLSRFPFVKVMQFCELTRLTGTVEVQQQGGCAVVRFEGGALQAEDGAAEAVVEQLIDLSAGAFVIRAPPVDFSGLLEQGEPAVGAEKGAAPRGAQNPTGRLSAVQMGSRLFQVQTEYLARPTPQLVTIVMLDGKSVLKRSSPVDGAADKESVERLIGEQHQAVEAEVEQKLRELAEKAGAESSRAKFDRLFEDGLGRFLARDYAAALEVWEKALAIEPANKVLGINIQVARKKLAAGQPTGRTNGLP